MIMPPPSSSRNVLLKMHPPFHSDTITFQTARWETGSQAFFVVGFGHLLASQVSEWYPLPFEHGWTLNAEEPCL